MQMLYMPKLIPENNFDTSEYKKIKKNLNFLYWNKFFIISVVLKKKKNAKVHLTAIMNFN